jgi:tetratricopeptide (TPR) repeat protein
MVAKTGLNQISLESLPKEVLDAIAFLREKKSKGRQTLTLIDKALTAAHDYIVRLYLEKVLVYQHEVMEDKSKPKGKQNKSRQSRYVKKMEEATNEAKVYVKRYNLKRWEARIQRFLGRVADYKKEYSRAVLHYRQAIKTAKKDPEYVAERIPRWFEYEAFLAYSALMSGRVEEGLSMSRSVYKRFDSTSDGKFLKRVDYPTWAIWKTGVPIRVGFWFIEKGNGLSKKELLDWLAEAEGVLKVPAGSKRWVGKVNFQFRLDEIASIRRRIGKT